jgi:hypothetical protein
MKKILLLSLFSLGVLGVVAHTGEAGLLRHLCGHCDSKFSTYICMRQYNAFTPICSGNLTCHGCCPMTFCGGMPPMPNPYMGGCMPPPMMCAPPPMVPPYCCTTGGCCDAECLPPPVTAYNGHYGVPAPVDPGSHGFSPVPAPVNPGSQGFTPPAPSPLPQMSYMGMNPGYMNNVQPVGYYPYNPYYYYGYYGQPYSYNPQYPNYWQGMPYYPYGR